MYISPQYDCIKKSLRGISQKSVDKTFSKKTKKLGGGGEGGCQWLSLRVRSKLIWPFCTKNAAFAAVLTLVASVSDQTTFYIQ